MSSGHSEIDRVKSHFEKNGCLPGEIIPSHVQELIDGCRQGDRLLREALEAEQRFNKEHDIS